MRTTLTLDSDVAALLERDIKARGVSFKAAVNDAIRQGLGGAGRVDIQFPAVDLGVSSYNLDHATTLAAALEDDEIIHKLERGN